MTDPVADALKRLHGREAAAVAAFRAAASEALTRLPSLAASEASIHEAALERALASQAEFTTLEDAGRRQALRAAAAAVAARELAAGGGSAEQTLYARLHGLPPLARRLAIAAFVRRESFVDVIQALNLNGAALAAEITEVRRLVNVDAASPPSADFPAYARVPFLVSGKLEPDDALRVREYLGQSEGCRAAYRDLDALERGLARLGPAAGESHPDPEEWLALSDDKPLTAERRDVLAEHGRLCRGCAAVASELASTAPRSAPRDLVKRLDAPRNRRRAAVAAAILSFALPVLTLEATRGAGRAFRFEAREGLDIGAPLLEDPGRAPFAWTDPGAALRMAVGLEPGVAYDFRLESSSAGEVASAGDVPVRDLGAGRGEIVFSLSGKPLPAGEYRLHVLRRIRRAGGEPADLVVPIVVR